MREGQVIQCDAPMQVYDEPASTFVGGFIGNPPMNFLHGVIHRNDGRVEVTLGSGGIEAPSSLASVDGQEVLVGIRAENLDVWTGQVDDALPAHIEVVEPLGADLLLTADIGGQLLKLLTRNDFPAAPGLDVSVRPQKDKLRWFDKHGMRLNLVEAAVPAR
jgi:multiple sugar transport system ATP-binding protein